MSFYAILIVVALYGFFFIGSTTSSQGQKQIKRASQSQENKANRQQNRVDIVEIQKQKHEKILKKMSYDQNTSVNKEYILDNLYKIKNKYVEEKFKEHQKMKMVKVKLQGQCGPAYTNYGFHGTKKICEGFNKICNDRANCPFCNILLHGFRNAFSGKGLSTDLRYGRGTYFSPKIQKALKYCQSDEKILLGCKLVMGKTFKPQNLEQYYMYFNGNQFDCVDADPEYTIDISEPEICMKNEKACLPKYIFVFRQRIN